MEQTKENKMGTMPVNKLLITMSLPMMVSMLVQALYNVVDSIFVSRINENALTAVSLAFPVQTLMIAVAGGTCVGINAVLSKALGEKEQERADHTAVSGIILMAVSYLLFLTVGLFATRPFYLTQTNDAQIVEFGVQYLSIVCNCSFGLFAQFVFERLLQSTGRTFYIMITQGTGAVINIILDPIFIFGLLGMPKMGVAGAAVATVISQMIGTALGIYFNLKKNPEIRFALSYLRPSLPIISRIYSVGVPSILLQTVASLLTFGLNQILVSFSETATAVYGVYFKLQGFAFLPIIGMNNGMVPIVAYNYGARKPERIVQTIRLAICYAVGIMVVAVVVFQLWPDKLLSIFQASEAMLDIGVPALKTLSLCFLIGGFTIVASSVFQALGMGLLSMTISVVRQLLLVLPLAYVFSLSGKLDLVWWSFPVAEVLAGALAAVFLRRAYLRVIRPLRELDYRF